MFSFKKLVTIDALAVQVVRYHSLVVDEDTLPKELVPTAWTCSGNTLSFLTTSCLVPDFCADNGS